MADTADRKLMRGKEHANPSAEIPQHGNSKNIERGTIISS